MIFFVIISTSYFQIEINLKYVKSNEKVAYVI